MWPKYRLSVLGSGTEGTREKSSQTDPVTISDDVTRLNKSLGIPSICARTQAQRKSTTHLDFIILHDGHSLFMLSNISGTCPAVQAPSPLRYTSTARYLCDSHPLSDWLPAVPTNTLPPSPTSTATLAVDQSNKPLFVSVSSLSGTVSPGAYLRYHQHIRWIECPSTGRNVSPE